MVVFGGVMILLTTSYENLELNLMKKYNMVYEEAHSLAEQKYNYKKELDEFLERIGG